MELNSHIFIILQIAILYLLHYCGILLKADENRCMSSFASNENKIICKYDKNVGKMGINILASKRRMIKND